MLSCCGAQTWRRCIPFSGRGLTDRRLSHPHVKVAVLSTFTNRSSDLADIPIVFKPGTDLAILNYIANHIISTGRVNQDFVTKHTNFVKGAVDIGYGRRPDDPMETKAKGAANPGATQPIDFDAYSKFREGLHARESLGAVRRGARFPARARRAVCRSVTQSNVALDHGLQPARPRRLGQPACLQSPSAHRKNLGTGEFAVLAHGATLACGTAREVGTFAHRLPADMTVTNPAHRKHAEEIWRVPSGSDPGEAGLSRGRAGPHAA